MGGGTIMKRKDMYALVKRIQNGYTVEDSTAYGDDRFIFCKNLLAVQAVLRKLDSKKETR